MAAQIKKRRWDNPIASTSQQMPGLQVGGLDRLAAVRACALDCHIENALHSLAQLIDAFRGCVASLLLDVSLDLARYRAKMPPQRNRLNARTDKEAMNEAERSSRTQYRGLH
jgi:hypothetical protein